MAEKSSFVRISDRPVNLDSVLLKYYPGFDFGRARDPIDSVVDSLASFGIGIHPDTLGAFREDSKRRPLHARNRLGEMLLLNAVSRDTEWSTPSVGNMMDSVTSIGCNLASGEGSRSVHGIRMSSGLSSDIAQKLDVVPGIATQLLRGIRIDGAYIAGENPEAWEHLASAAGQFICEYRSQCPSLQHDGGMIDEMELAKTSTELYQALYNVQSKRGGYRRIGSFMPYELDYWRWLVDSGIVASYRHLPFTQAVLNGHITEMNHNVAIVNGIRRETGIPVDPNILNLRVRIIRKDLPSII